MNHTAHHTARITLHRQLASLHERLAIALAGDAPTYVIEQLEAEIDALQSCDSYDQDLAEWQAQVDATAQGEIPPPPPTPQTSVCEPDWRDELTAEELDQMERDAIEGNERGGRLVVIRGGLFVDKADLDEDEDTKDDGESDQDEDYERAAWCNR